MRLGNWCRCRVQRNDYLYPSTTSPSSSSSSSSPQTRQPISIAGEIAAIHVVESRPSRSNSAPESAEPAGAGHAPAAAAISRCLSRQRCQSLDCACATSATWPPLLADMATDWLPVSYEASAASAGSDDVEVGVGSTTTQQQRHPHVKTLSHCQQKSSSWDSGYSDVGSSVDRETTSEPPDNLSPTAVTARRPMRMPSVVVIDCSDNYHHDSINSDNNGDVLSLSLTPSPSSHSHSPSTSSQSDLTSMLDNSEASSTTSWSWPASAYRTPSSSNGLLVLPGITSPDVDDLAMQTSSLLSVRRLSDCSSSSSLATLDMEPCCSSEVGGACSDSEARHHRASFDLSSSDVESTDRPTVSEPATPVCKLPSVKVSAWRKVRSAVQWSPFVQTFRRQRYPWVQLAGHQGNFKVGGERGTILKKLCPKEESCFQLLMEDPLRPFIPSYKGNITTDDGEKFLVLEDLLGEFRNPAVMDCKLGVRTYLEEELAKAKLKPKLRKDMFEKMLQVDPTAPTSEELQLGGVTKPRYMVWRETISSTASLGFRIEGIRNQDGSSSKDYKTVGTPQQILGVLRDFVQDHPRVLIQYVARLNELAATLAKSEFFASHELIGSSLLFIHDNTKAGVWMIDFAKTYRLPTGIEIDHRSPWRVGNHEDGYLIGLGNLTQLFEQLLVSQDENENEAHHSSDSNIST